MINGTIMTIRSWPDDDQGHFSAVWKHPRDGGEVWHTDHTGKVPIVTPDGEALLTNAGTPYYGEPATESPKLEFVAHGSVPAPDYGDEALGEPEQAQPTEALSEIDAGHEGEPFDDHSEEY